MTLINSFLLCFSLFLLATDVLAGSSVVMVTEDINGENIKTSYQVVSFDENRMRIDFPGAKQEITEKTPFIMTADNGDTWVMADPSSEEYFCSRMMTEQFFKNIGDQLNDASSMFNVETAPPEITKVLEEPGPEMLGFKTTRVRLEVNADARARFLFMKFRYSLKIVDDLWYTTDQAVHPIREKWLNALSTSGNEIIDKMITEYRNNLPGPVLKSETVTIVTDHKKDKTDTNRRHTYYTDLKTIEADEMDKLFVQPECYSMSDSEVRKKAQYLLKKGRIAL